MLRCDQEPALVDLMNAIAKERSPAPTVFEHSKVEDSQSNGFIERGVRSVEEMTRVMKLDIEERIGTEIAVSDPIFAWIVEHATDLLNTLNVGADGKTPYERIKGKRYCGEFLPLGSPVMLRVTGKVQGGRCKRGGTQAFGWARGSTHQSMSCAVVRTARWLEQEVYEKCQIS